MANVEHRIHKIPINNEMKQDRLWRSSARETINPIQFSELLNQRRRDNTHNFLKRLDKF